MLVTAVLMMTVLPGSGPWLTRFPPQRGLVTAPVGRALLACAGELPTSTPRRALPHVDGSEYTVEHWLAAYALLYVDEQC